MNEVLEKIKQDKLYYSEHPRKAIKRGGLFICNFCKTINTKAIILEEKFGSDFKEVIFLRCSRCGKLSLRRTKHIRRTIYSI